MKLIDVTYDAEGNKTVGDMTKFDPIMAGEVTVKKVYVKNVIAFPVDVNISVEGEDVEIKDNFNRINPSETKELSLVFSPKLTKLKPINVSIKIHAMTLVE